MSASEPIAVLDAEKASNKKMINTFMDKMALNLLELDWSPEHISESLEAVYQYAIYKVNRAISWYDRDARRKKIWARSLRMIAILFTALGGIFPILIPILNDWGIELSATWATIVLAVAATAVGTDRFFGFSSSWIRSITTGMKLRDMLDAFQFGWEGELVMMAGEPPTTEQAQALVARCGQFISDVAAVVQEETQQWVQEFRSSLQELDQKISEAQTTSRTSALVVTVVNSEFTDDGWTLTLDTRRPTHHVGASAVVTGLFAGIYKVSVEATIKGKPTRAETAVNVQPGEVAGVTLTLEIPQKEK